MSRRKKIIITAISCVGIVVIGAAVWIESYFSAGWPHLRSLPSFTVTQPKLEDVFGTYLLTQQTITTNGLAVLQGRECQLDLQPDGLFQVTNYPTWTNDQFESLISTSGNWHLDTVGLARNNQRIWGIRFLNTNRKVGTLALTGKSHYGLMMTYGDGDEGAVMIFKKK